ncbi:DMT family transporter [Celerinatantimonas sp. YJH-8]|uniref:DMT family transporter n=1 Tax=Celerinatantimonas sp. YJH-8 TaxID=3228714 RepID=UPI0038C0C9E4
MLLRYYGHLLALISVIVWGSTFISTKVLLQDLSPIQILFYRCIVAWIVLAIIRPKFFYKINIKNELLYFLASLFGVSIYFLFENYALQMTYASNASLIVTTSPIISTVFIFLLFKQNNFNRKNLLGTLISIIGVYLVIKEGSLDININPKGDLLALLAAIVWSLFAITLDCIDDEIDTIIRVRKIFAYAIITIFIVMLFLNESFLNHHFFATSDLYNILFLGIVASGACYIFWNKAVEYIGVSKTMLYMYLVPVTTIVMGYFILSEKMSSVMVLGSCMIIIGIVVFNMNKSKQAKVLQEES